MASSTPVEVRRSGEHTFVATNGRGGEVTIGRDGVLDGFTPGELLLAAIAGCAGVTAETLITRRVGEDAEVVVRADRTKPEDDPHIFDGVQTRFDLDLSALDAEERTKLVELVHRAIEKNCTVSRTVVKGAPVSIEV